MARESGEGSRALIKGARLNAKDPFMRKGSVRRSTKETDVEVAIDPRAANEVPSTKGSLGG